jgi:sugar lactone lactonase YvrE
LTGPVGIALDPSGNLYVADAAIRRVAAGTGTITTVAGVAASGLAVDPAGNLYIAATNSNVILKITAATGATTTVAGGAGQGFGGDNGAATSAKLYLPGGVAVDSNGNLYIADTNNDRIRKVAAGTGTITTVAGDGYAAFSGDNGPATGAQLNAPQGVAIDSSGNVYIADSHNGRTGDNNGRIRIVYH